MKRFIDVDAARLAGLQIDLLQKVRNGQITLEQLGWYLGLNKITREALVEGRHCTDSRFELINSFDIVVPEGYNHSNRLEVFRREYGKTFKYFHRQITDKNFENVTTKLVSGQKFDVRFFRFRGRVTSRDCLTFLHYNKATLVGAQGASLVFELAKDRLPAGEWIVSLDESTRLWKNPDTGWCEAPCVARYSDGYQGFSLQASFAGDDDGAEEKCMLWYDDGDPDPIDDAAISLMAFFELPAERVCGC